MDFDRLVPGFAKAMNALDAAAAATGLEQSLRELVRTHASRINGCAYCIGMHSRDLLKADVPIEKLLLVSAWDESGSLFSDQEKAALKWAEVVTRVSETHVPEEAYAEARAMFSEKELDDLTIAIGLMNAFNRLAISFRATPLAAAPAAAA
jgi:AhpD family alkylhydroperoxidase